MNPTPFSAQLGSFVRHLLSALGGFLIAHGIYAGTQGDFVDQLAPVSLQVAAGVLAWLTAHASAWMRNHSLGSKPFKVPRTLGLVLGSSFLVLGCSSCSLVSKRSAAPVSPDEFDQAINRMAAGMFKPLLALLCLALISCAPVTMMTFNPDGSLKSIAHHDGALHEADAVATEIRAKDIVIRTVMKKPNGTGVAKAGLASWGLVKLGEAHEGTLRTENTNAAGVTNTKTTTAAATEQLKIKSSANSAAFQGALDHGAVPTVGTVTPAGAP
jgi:hypothetical protein